MTSLLALILSVCLNLLYIRHRESYTDETLPSMNINNYSMKKRELSVSGCSGEAQGTLVWRDQAGLHGAVGM